MELFKGFYINQIVGKLTEKTSVQRMSPERIKFRIYLVLNPELEMHPLYKISGAHDTTDDYLRIAFTRLRLCSHKLRSGTGRWSHTPSYCHLCPHCGDGSIQDENHVLRCSKTKPILDKYGCVITDLPTLFTNCSKSTLLMLNECTELS